MVKYTKIEGILKIYKTGSVIVGSRRLTGDESVVLKVRTLKQIIKDAKKGII